MADSDLLITKATIILDQPDHWTLWMFLRKETADRGKIWKYVDPDIDEELLPQLEDERPIEKEFKDFKTSPQDGDAEVEITDLTQSEQASYDLWYRAFIRKEAQWAKKEKALDDFKTEISRTIAARHIHLIADCTSAHDRLRTLKKHLCPSKAERSAQLQARYQALKTRPRKGNLDTWFEEWLETTRLMTQAKLPEVEGNRAQQDFILAVKSLDDSWAANELSQLIKAEADDKPYTSTSDLVAQYASYYRRTQPIASGLGTFATLSISPPESSASSPPSSQSPHGQERQQSRAIVCLCGEKHKFENCLYVNKSLRPKDWKPVKEIEQAFQELRLSETPKAIVLQSVEKRLASSSDSKPKPIARWDDGKMPEVHGRSMVW